MKRTSLLLLTALLLAGTFTSCGDDTKTPVTSDNGETKQTADTTAAESEDGEYLYSQHLDTVDYGGAEFKIFTSNNINGMTSSILLNHAEDENGEVINDALFNRDRFLEETYNVTLNYTCDETSSAPQMAQNLAKNILAGDDAYQLIIQDHATVTKGLASQGAIYPLNYLDEIHLDTAYWMPELNESSKIGGSVYYPSCMISPRYFGSVYIMMFNRDLAQSLDLEDMYELVSNGKWTFDKMMELARQAVRDLDGDGKIEGDDQLGMMYDSHEAILLGGGFHFVYNKNGTLTCGLEDSALITYIQKVTEAFQETGIYYAGNSAVDYDGVLNNGSALFTNPCTYQLDDFRDLNYDYGILPMPKKDEAQQEYVSFSQPWINAAPSIPVTVTGDALSMTGTLTDAMVAYGYDYIRPAVYDNVIRIKGTRDEQSAKIVDQIFTNVSIELSCTLWMSSFSEINKLFGANLGKQDVTSVYAAQKNAIESELASVMDTYAAFDIMNN